MISIYAYIHTQYRLAYPVKSIPARAPSKVRQRVRLARRAEAAALLVQLL